MARKGTPGEKVISWSVTADGDLIMEKEAEVGQDAETGENDWIATKIGKDGSVLVDEHGNKNEWIITDTVFWQKYRQDQEQRDTMYQLVSVRHFYDFRRQLRCASGARNV